MPRFGRKSAAWSGQSRDTERSWTSSKGFAPTGPLSLDLPRLVRLAWGDRVRPAGDGHRVETEEAPRTPDDADPIGEARPAAEA